MLMKYQNLPIGKSNRMRYHALGQGFGLIFVTICGLGLPERFGGFFIVFKTALGVYSE